MMFGNFSQQLKKTTKPASTLLEMNAKALELVSKQQTVFFSGVMTDSVRLMGALSEQTEVQGIVAAQSVYAESLRERLTSASKTTYGALSSIGKNAVQELSTSVGNIGADKSAGIATSTAKPLAKKTVAKRVAVKKAPTKKAPAAKAASSEVTKQKITPEAPPAVPAKPVVESAVTQTKVSTAPAKQALAKKTAAAPAKATASTTAKPVKAAAKKAAPKRTVATLSPADVKAEQPKTA